AGQGKIAEAEKLIRGVMANPTVMVSKEMATVELARVLVKTRPADARKLLEPLRIERTAVSKAAITTLGDLPQQ
ncbi:MAG: hypothetical protein ACRD2Y_09155, partial [Terriglobales bacterium]